MSEQSQRAAEQSFLDMVKLRAEIDRLRKALEPFAAEAERWSYQVPDDRTILTRCLRVRDLRQAKAALATAEGR